MNRQFRGLLDSDDVHQRNAVTLLIRYSLIFVWNKRVGALNTYA